ncbi:MULTISPECIES: ricin-type beta-trefoil lectin domain protein [Streptomyces]|uniref:Ricin-type beta-trefoil lectin domain protein n=1 Tax=Streptomyces doudnae TaxID=3075536 RepID=A0ABD5EFZ5_9ACTN|nr:MULTISPECIES: ricin-type beta-trefoil lectin domain protein [unclassified Streptomyces]MDT0433324.1 ricin-type beta-trefoil lectin domain protein [Streptomyces sp. DSM 41981]SCE42962.1 Ricin-type beta-trefoil lectin domain-containing protein [Streptomyces sp. SolWspMP-5a-2]
MKFALAPRRRTALALVATGCLLWPAVSPLSQPASASTGAYDLLYDPGPAHDCWGRIVDDDPGRSDPAHVDTSGCGPFAADKEFQRSVDRPESSPTWDMGTLGWDTADWGRTPGFSFSARTGSRTVTMTNGAAGGDCGPLRETNVSYTYQNSQLRWGPDRRKLTLGDGTVNVSYRASVRQSGSFTCPEKRAILTTDFIFDDLAHRETALLSVVHYDARNAFTGPVAGDVVWSTLNPDGRSCQAGYGCRVMVKSPAGMLGEGQDGPVGDDVSALFDRYARYLNPGGLPKSNFAFRGLQIVSSNRGASTTSSVSDVRATLTPNGPVVTTLRNRDKQGNLCLDVDGNKQTSPADAQIYTCNTSSAQRWTVGLDGTLRANGLCLDAEGAGTANGTEVNLWSCNGGRNQQWVLGRYGQLYNPASARCLEVTGGSTESGYSDLRLYDCWGGTNQKWWTPYGDFHDQ